MRHLVELTVRDIRQIIVDHGDRSLSVSIKLEDVEFKIGTYNYGEAHEFEGVDVVIDKA